MIFNLYNSVNLIYSLLSTIMVSKNVMAFTSKQPQMFLSSLHTHTISKYLTAKCMNLTIVKSTNITGIAKIENSSR